MPTGTNRWGTVEWGANAPNAGTGLTLDVANSAADAIYRLGFMNSSELTSTSWVTSAELYQWGDEAAKKLAYEAGVFVTYDNSIAAVSGTAVYSLPASHVFTLQAALLYAQTLQLLRLTAVRDLWALDGNWTTTTGNPTRASMDAGAVGTVTLYPQPITSATLGQICQEFPATVAQGSSTLPLPTVLQDYFTYALLAGARGKESDAAMPEMAKHYSERCRLYEQIIEHLWGPGQ